MRPARSAARRQARCFRAVVCRGRAEPAGTTVEHFAELSELPRQDPAASVTVRVTHSTVNYKDAMILAGQRGVVSQFPIVGGIDCAGVVEQSDSPMWAPGDHVVVTGNKIGQTFDGGYSEKLRVRAEWLTRPPPGYSLEDAMTAGSAGITAMMCVAHLEEAGGLAEWRGRGDGPVLVTGAGGGLGAFAVAILSRLGYHAVASTGRNDLAGRRRGHPPPHVRPQEASRG
eukprot:TRINITY_DN31052_c0_g1_i1.p2 TRINITY_DN31052_c0_g1~~TRINITY_DN31052_c0_g1_i1.p2  ORF type:complete len:228 (+),score=48.27 TRINITY_DN31052_c0_g1_i1:84-767(+)